MGKGVHSLMTLPADFSISIKFDSIDSQSDNLAWGYLSASVNGREVWYQQDQLADEPTPVHWAWFNLLSYLGKNWSALKFEEAYPLNLNPINPLKLRELAEKGWEEMDSDQVDEEDEEIFNFERRHDLASGLDGIFLPSLFVLKEGNMAWVCCDNEVARLDFTKVMGTLESVGNEISEQLKDSTDGRAVRAVRLWDNRNAHTTDTIIELRSGMRSEELKALAGEMAANDYWEIDADFNDNEILAAARYSSGVLSAEYQKHVLDLIKTIDFVETPGLDKLSADCLSVLKDYHQEPPFTQGYLAAGWLRKELGVTGNFSPEEYLKQWGVQTIEIKVVAQLEALAFWGRSHGPAILVNTTEGALCNKTQGLRTTLAHEIAHLLMDRSGSLPFADAIGGTTPVWVEKRARAFAAELLLPREIASAAIEAKDLDSLTIKEFDQEVLQLSADYRVSSGLVIHQLKNSRLLTMLPLKIKTHLKRRNQEVSPFGERKQEL